MCGITGVIDFSGIPGNASESIAVMTRALAHRGPDAEGFFQDEYVGFGHRRLSIIDLSASANQPIQTLENDIVLVFNGEIYNHAPIRKDLEKTYAFKTDHSDTEMILYAYKKYGIETLHQFNGMFSFALYDIPRKKVFLVRDRLGIKPLYFKRKNSCIWFSSEIHPIFQAGIAEKRIEDQAVYNYLTFLTTDAPQTFYSGIEKLESGHYLEISPDGIKKEKYWDISDYLNSECNDPFSHAVSKTRERLEHAVALRNIADVRVSIALSGGLDSSLNLFESRKVNDHLSSINISYAEKSQYDESEVARRLSSDLGVDFIHKTVTLEHFQRLILEYLSVQKDMPLGDPNVCLMYHISQIARQEGIKVLLVGEGGDEIGGYPVYLELRKLYSILKPFGKGVHRGLSILPPRLAHNFDIFHKGGMISKRHIHGFSNLEKSRFWIGEKSENSYDILWKYMAQINGSSPESYLRKVSNIEYKLRLPELILPRVDYPSMAASIEARSPFMDHKLIEYSASLPFSLRMKNGPKSLLRAIASEKLPAYILDQRKVGFGMLLTPFLKDTLPKWMYADIVEKTPPIKNYISGKYIVDLLRDHQKNKRQGFKLWIIYALHKWLLANNI